MLLVSDVNYGHLCLSQPAGITTYVQMKKNRHFSVINIQ